MTPIFMTEEAILTFSPFEQQILRWGVSRGDIYIQKDARTDKSGEQKK